MSKPQTYRDVDLPDEWNKFGDDAKVNYLCNVVDRDQLLELVGDAGNVPNHEIGEQSFHKAGLAQLLVTLEKVDE